MKFEGKKGLENAEWRENSCAQKNKDLEKCNNFMNFCGISSLWIIFHDKSRLNSSLFFASFEFRALSHFSAKTSLCCLARNSGAQRTKKSEFLWKMDIWEEGLIGEIFAQMCPGFPAVPKCRRLVQEKSAGNVYFGGNIYLWQIWEGKFSDIIVHARVSWLIAVEPHLGVIDFAKFLTP